MKFLWLSWYFECEMQLKTEPEILSTWFGSRGNSLRSKNQNRI